MEKALIAALKTFLELLAGAACLFPWEILIVLREKRNSTMMDPPGDGTLYVSAPIFGALFAALSLFLIPHAILGNAAERLANLLLTPLVCALIAGSLARRRNRRGQRSDQRLHFWFALLFSIGFVVVRFLWATRTTVT